MEIGEETRVLIVDDFNTSRRMIRQTLKKILVQNFVMKPKILTRQSSCWSAINITWYWLIGMWMDPEV